MGLAGAIALGVLSAPIRKEGTPRGDDLIYEDIARHPFGVHTFPFGFRLGLPLAVHWLPFDHTVSFSGLALLAAGGAAAFAYPLMRELGGERRVASALAVLMSVSPPFLIVALRHGRNPDIATVFFMMAATYFAVRRQRWPLAVALLLGVVVREAVLFVVPLAYALWAVRRSIGGRRSTAWRWRRPRSPRTPPSGSASARRRGQVPGYAGSLIGERFTVVKLGLQSAFREARRMFTVYGPLWLVAPLALRDMRFAWRGLVLVALALLSMTFALDWCMQILLAPGLRSASAYVLGSARAGPGRVRHSCAAIGHAAYMDYRGRAASSTTRRRRTPCSTERSRP